MTQGAAVTTDLTRECARALEAFGLSIDDQADQPIFVLKQDDDSTVLRVRCLDEGASKFVVAKYRSAEDKLVPFMLTAKIEKLLRNEHSVLAWSDASELQSLIPKRRKGKDGQTIWREAVPADLGTGCWSVSEYIDDAYAFDWLEASPKWTAEHAREAGELLAMLHLAGHSAKEKLTGAEAHQLSSILSTVPSLLREAFEESQVSLKKGGANPQEAGEDEKPLTLSPEKQGKIAARVAESVAALTSGSDAAALAEEIVIVHGDYHPGNILFSSKAAVSVIDLDYAHLENPLYDLAYGLLMFTNGSRENCGESFIDGYLQHHQQIAIEPPAYFEKQPALSALAGSEAGKNTPMQHFFVVAAGLILIWTLSSAFGRRPGALAVAARMAKRLAS